MDDAFGKLPDGTVEFRKTGEQGRIDLHFDVPCSFGQNYVDRSIRWYESQNVERQEVTIHLKEGKVFINDAEVVLADVKRIKLYMPS
jgi:uncharacterized surface protein with fasciclin (FAS1) repeats